MNSMDTLPGPSLESQIIFRLASLEATLSTSLLNLNEKLDTLSKDFHHKDVNRAQQITALDVKFNSLKENLEEKIEQNKESINGRVTRLEFFRTELLAKATAVAAVVGLVWIIVGDPLKKFIGVE